MKKTRKTINRILAVSLALVLFFGTLDTMVFAADEPTDAMQIDHEDTAPSDEGTQTDTALQGTEEYEKENGGKVSVSFEKTEEEKDYNPGDPGVIPVPDETPASEESGSVTLSGEDGDAAQNPEGDGSASSTDSEESGQITPTPGETPDSSISVTVDTTKEGNSESTDFTVDIEPEKVIPVPSKPDKYDDNGKHHEENPVNNEYGEGTETVDETWTYEPIEEEGYHGYKTTAVKTIITEATKEGVPETKPENSYEVDGGYQYSETVELEDGTARTIIVTVTNGQTHTKIIDNITIETIEKVKVIDSNGNKKAEVSEGSVSVTVTKVVNGKVEVSKPVSFDTISGNYNEFGYDEKNDLYDREGSKGLMTIKVNEKNGEGGSEVYVWTYDKSTGSLKYQYNGGNKNKKQTLKGGTEVYVYEIVKLKSGAYIYRIGEDDWIISNDASKILGGTYEVNNKEMNGIYIVDDETKEKGEKPSKENLIGSRLNGKYVRVLEIDGEWCRIATDGNSSGWVLKSQLSALPVMGDEQWKEQEFASKFDDGKLEEIFGPEADGYDYYYFGENGLESSIRVSLEGGSNTWLAHQFILRDKETNKFYVYCADLGTEAKKDYRYKLIPIDHVKVEEEDQGDENYVGYLSKEDLEHMKAIAQNGYWGTDDDLKELKAKLESAGIDKNIVENITPGIALTATQAALWVYGTSDNKKINQNTDEWVKYLGEYYNYYVDSNGKAHAAMNTFDHLDDEEKEALKTVFKWLLSKEADESTDAITEDNFATSATITVNKVVEDVNVELSDGSVGSVMYDTDVSFAMQVRPSSKNDDLIVTIYANVDGKETAVASCRLSGDPQEGDKFTHNITYDAESNTYKIAGVRLPNGAGIRINLTGVQDLGKGIYIFKSDEKDGGAQTFIGRSGESSKQDVDLNVELNFNVTAAKATIIKTTVTTGTYETPKPPKPSESPDPSPSNPPGPRNNPDPDPEPGSDPVPTPVTVPDPEVPLAETPELVEISDGPVPLAARPDGLVDIFDEDVPLAAVPRTGDISDIWYVVTVMAACGLLVIFAKSRKKHR